MFQTLISDGVLRAGAALAAVALVAGCAVRPTPLEDNERAGIAQQSRERLFAGQEELTQPLTLYEATARAIKYQADYRAKLMEDAAALTQLDVAQFDMLPKLTANAGYSSRNNDSFGFGFTPDGSIATNPTASVERTYKTANIGFTWSILDFGVSYYRAKQLADQSLIMEERRRKAMQNLVQDVRLAWWRAEAAQRLMPLIDQLFDDIAESIEKTRVIEGRRLLPPMQTASLRRALLDLQQQIAERRIELAQARVDLNALINAPPGAEVKLAVPEETSAANLDLVASIDALETIALRNRSEVAEETYKGRIDENEARKALLATFPNLTLILMRNWDTNRFLVNSNWNSVGLNAAFNLTKVFSLPAQNRSREAQRQLDEARRLAMAMAVMTQTRIATVRFAMLADEFRVWDEATRDDGQIVDYLSSSANVGVDNELELIRAKARYLTSKVNRDLVYANLEGALGRIYNSVGLDPVPADADNQAVPALANQLRTTIGKWQGENFVQRKAYGPVAVAIGNIQGVPQKAVKEFRGAIDRVLELSKIARTEDPRAPLRVLATINLEPARDGGRPAVVRVRLLESRTGAVRYASEFRTTLSEPIDPEQWRTLGEGTAYRVLPPINRLQADTAFTASLVSVSSRMDLRLTSAIADETQRNKAAPETSSEDQGQLALRLDTGIDMGAQATGRVGAR